MNQPIREMAYGELHSKYMTATRSLETTCAAVQKLVAEWDAYSQTRDDQGDDFVDGTRQQAKGCADELTSVLSWLFAVRRADHD